MVSPGGEQARCIDRQEGGNRAAMAAQQEGLVAAPAVDGAQGVFLAALPAQERIAAVGDLADRVLEPVQNARHGALLKVPQAQLARTGADG